MLRCKLCALAGVDELATYACCAGSRDQYPLCRAHALTIAWRSRTVRTLQPEDQAAIINPRLAHPGRWKEQFGRNRPYPTRRTTTRHTGE